MILTPQEVARLANEACQKLSGKFPSLASSKMWRRVLVALAKTESGNNPLAKNRSSSARGLMQILKGTQADIERRLGLTPKAPEALDDPAYSMLLAAYYVAWLHMNKAAKSWEKTVVAYNQGHYNTSAAGKRYRDKVWASYATTPWWQTSPNA